MIGNLFNSLFFEPILALLVFIYDHVAFNDLGLAIIALTVLIRLVLFPLFYRGAKDQTLIQKLQPRIEEIKNKHKKNREEQTKALMTLYREHKLNPLSGFLILIIQLPIFIALFQIFRNPDTISSTFDNPFFLGLINLGEVVMVFALLAAVLQYFQGKLAFSKRKTTSPANSPLANFTKTFIYAGPIISLMILTRLPSALALYWIVSTLFSLGQQFIINKKLEYIDHGGNTIENKKSD